MITTLISPQYPEGSNNQESDTLSNTRIKITHCAQWVLPLLLLRFHRGLPFLQLHTILKMHRPTSPCPPYNSLKICRSKGKEEISGFYFPDHVKSDHFCQHLQLLPASCMLQTERICKVFLVASKLKPSFSTCKGLHFHMDCCLVLPSHRAAFSSLFAWPLTRVVPLLLLKDRNEQQHRSTSETRTQDLSHTVVAILDNIPWSAVFFIWLSTLEASNTSPSPPHSLYINTPVQQLGRISKFGTKTPESTAGSALPPWQHRRAAPSQLVPSSLLGPGSSTSNILHPDVFHYGAFPALEMAPYPISCALTAYIWL